MPFCVRKKSIELFLNPHKNPLNEISHQKDQKNGDPGGAVVVSLETVGDDVSHAASSYHAHDGGSTDIDLHAVEKPGEKAAQTGGQNGLADSLGEGSAYGLKALHAVLGYVFHGLHEGPHHKGKAGDAQGHKSYAGAYAQRGEEDEGPYQGRDVAQEGGKTTDGFGCPGKGRDLFASKEGDEKCQDRGHGGGGHGKSQGNQDAGENPGYAAGLGKSGRQEVLGNKFPEGVPVGNEGHGSFFPT